MRQATRARRQRRQGRAGSEPFGSRRYAPLDPDQARAAVLAATGGREVRGRARLEDAAPAPDTRARAHALAEPEPEAEPAGPRLYVGELVWDGLRAGEAAGLGALERHTLQRLAACRTPALGGTRERCLPCAYDQVVFRSCGSRHCPRCQSLVGARWHERELGRVLEVDHFHLVLTLPPALRDPDRRAPCAVYGLLFRATRRAIEDTAREVLGEAVTLSITLVLHTWNASFGWHPHVHAIVSAGGLSADGRWLEPAPGKCLLPADVLERHARAALEREVRRAVAAARKGKGGRVALELGDEELALRLARLEDGYVHVYAKRPLAGPMDVIGYLARYMGRPGFSDRQLLEYDPMTGRVVYRTKRGERVKCTRAQFLARLVAHQLPKGFHRVRRYGLLAPRRQKELLAAARAALGSLPAAPGASASGAVLESGGSFVERWYREQGIDLCACPRCGARLLQTPVTADFSPQVRRQGWRQQRSERSARSERAAPTTGPAITTAAREAPS